MHKGVYPHVTDAAGDFSKAPPFWVSPPRWLFCSQESCVGVPFCLSLLGSPVQDVFSHLQVLGGSGHPTRLALM